jgi:two-component system cell cycle response regulator DivK
MWNLRGRYMSEIIKPQRILIAEDNDSNYGVLKAMLDDKYQLYRAVDGVEAVSLFDYIDPVLIFMDLNMPKLDGIDAITFLRTKTKNTPIVVLTAYADDDYKQRAIESGCNEYIVKPFRKAEIDKVCSKYITEQSIQAMIDEKATTD